MANKGNIIKRMIRLGASDAAAIESILEKTDDGGPGSGNFGHKGRPGQIGGSGPGGGSGTGGGSPNSVESYEEYRKNLAKEPGRGGPMEYTKGKTPELLKKAESPKGLGIEEIFSEKALPPTEPKDDRGAARTAHKELNDNLIATADWCFKEKDNYDPDSIEYKAYKALEDEFAYHKYERPRDSKEMARERLSNISKQLKPYAVSRYKKDIQNEPQITKDVCDIADALGTQMHGLEYRTKVASENKNGICRIQQKIEQDLAEAEAKASAKGEKSTLTYEQCVDGLNDLVRYTQLGTEKNLVSNYEKTRAALEKKGYKVVKVKNFYNKDPMVNPYRGLTCVFESPTGTKFEFQFHTPRSLAAKNAMHPIYEIDRGYDPNDPSNSKITTSEHMKLQERMRNVSSREKVPYPIGIEKIQDYPPKK